jgi:hypothetical protein
MQPACACTFTIVLRVLFSSALFIAIFLFSPPAFAQQVAKDTVPAIADTAHKTHAITETEETITSFEELNFPPEMLKHFEEITPNDIVTLTEEFQVTQNDEDGIPTVITVKLHFENNYLAGYIIEAPIDKTIEVTVSHFTVKIPIEWVCTPPGDEHPQHYVSSIAAVKTAEDEYKCTGWHIKLPQMQQEVVAKKSKKGRKGKKSKKLAAPAPAPSATTT